MIEVQKVTKYYGSFKAVDDISFSISKGEIVGLLGPNGAGKTTTMRMVTGFLSASEGTITVDGLDIREEPKSVKRKIGYLPESAPLYGDMIVADYLEWVARVQHEDPKKKVQQVAAACGLNEVMYKNVSDLSRGYRQRVGLAHALIHDPEILILDEPTSGLDPNQIIEVRALIKELGKTRTVIISTHILSEVEMLCDRVIIVSNGKIVADSPTPELRSRYGHKAVLSLLLGKADYTAVSAALSALPGVETLTRLTGEGDLLSLELALDSSSDIRPVVYEAIKSKDWVLYEMSLQRNSLEDVFRSLTTGGNS